MSRLNTTGYPLVSTMLYVLDCSREYAYAYNRIYNRFTNNVCDTVRESCIALQYDSVRAGEPIGATEVTPQLYTAMRECINSYNQYSDIRCNTQHEFDVIIARCKAVYTSVQHMIGGNTINTRAQKQMVMDHINAVIKGKNRTSIQLLVYYGINDRLLSIDYASGLLLDGFMVGDVLDEGTCTMAVCTRHLDNMDSKHELLVARYTENMRELTRLQ